MRIDRVALVILGVIAVVMTVNYVTATSRFLDANRAYDGLTLTLQDFSFTDAASPVVVDIAIENPVDSDVEILAINLTLRAGIQSVGGEGIRVDEVLAQGETRVYRIDARITDQNIVRQLEGEEIRWLIRGEIQVRLDDDLEPVWIQFSVRTVTP